MKFTLEIELDNELMQTGEDVRLALEGAAERWNQGTITEPNDLGDGVIFDANGNRVGKYEVLHSPIRAANDIPDSHEVCRCGRKEHFITCCDEDGNADGTAADAANSGGWK